MIETFRQAMRSTGIETEDDLLADGTLLRFHVAGDKTGTKNVWYVFHPDEPMSGALGDWRLGISKTLTSKDSTSMPPADKDKLEARMQETKRLRSAQNEVTGAVSGRRAGL